MKKSNDCYFGIKYWKVEFSQSVGRCGKKVGSKFSIFNSRFAKGQSLFEVVFAIGIAALIIVGVVALATKSVGNSNSSTDSSLATRFVQEITECLREERDLDWDDFVDAAPSGPAACGSEVSGIFSQNIAMTCYEENPSPPPQTTSVNCNDASAIIVVVEAEISVNWSDGSGDHSVVSSTRFSDWRRN